VESVTVVIPAFNEATTLSAVVADITDAMDDYDGEWEIVIVDDGSTDGTAEVAQSLTGERIRLLRHERNRGSGMAIRTGLNDAHCDLVVYVPADGQFDPYEIPRFADAAQNADIVIGARQHREGYGWVRKLQSIVYVRLVNLLFGQNFGDVNWVHMWRRDTAGRLPVKAEGVFMQQELLARARRNGMRVVEVPSEFLRRQGGLAKGSKASVIWITLREMLAYLFGRKGS